MIKPLIERPAFELTPSELKHGLLARPATEADVTIACDIIHRAFDVWKELGLSLSPMFQSDAKTREHLVDKGYVVETPGKFLVGTFSVEDGRLEKNGAIVRFFEGNDAPLPFEQIGPEISPTGRFLVFRKAAVLPDFRKHGLGLQMLEIAEAVAKRNSYRGIVLETVESADWLFNWYLRLGFKVIGKYRYPNSKVETLLMVRPFAEMGK